MKRGKNKTDHVQFDNYEQRRRDEQKDEGIVHATT